MASKEEHAADFEIKERHVGEVTILELKGRIALGIGSQALNDKLQTLIGQGRIKLLLHCSEVTALDSQGISSLVRGVISTRKRGGQLKLLKPSSRAHHVLDTTRLLTVIESFDDEAEALGSF
jgi:anti-sigma B factor antagonist